MNKDVEWPEPMDETDEPVIATNLLRRLEMAAEDTAAQLSAMRRDRDVVFLLGLAFGLLLALQVLRRSD